MNGQTRWTKALFWEGGPLLATLFLCVVYGLIAVWRALFSCFLPEFILDWFCECKKVFSLPLLQSHSRKQSEGVSSFPSIPFPQKACLSLTLITPNQNTIRDQS